MAGELKRYGFAFGLTTLAAVLRLTLSSLGTGVPFILFYPAVAASGWYGGFGPALLSTLMAALLSILFLIHDARSAAGMQTAIFVLSGTLMALFAEQARHAQRKVAESEERLRQSLAAEQAARNRAEESSQLKDEFLATVSHELKTPLTAILGWCRVLRSIKVPPETIERALESIDRNAQSQNRVIDDLLDVSRVIAGQLRIRPELVDPKTVIDAAMDSVRPSAEVRGIGMESSLVTGSLIYVDPHRLQQIVLNLLTNSVKFTATGGLIRVLAHEVDGYVEIIVHDNGQGISKEFLSNVFERFRQADSSQTRSHGGLGLGLSIVRHLVEMMGGMVSGESPGKGMGATFKVRFPIRDSIRLEA